MICAMTQRPALSWQAPAADQRQLYDAWHGRLLLSGKSCGSLGIDVRKILGGLMVPACAVALSFQGRIRHCSIGFNVYFDFKFYDPPSGHTMATRCPEPISLWVASHSQVQVHRRACR